MGKGGFIYLSSVIPALVPKSLNVECKVSAKVLFQQKKYNRLKMLADTEQKIPRFDVKLI